MTSPTRDLSIVLIQPPSLCVSDDRLEAPLGLMYLAAVLRSRGYHAVAIEDLSGARTEKEVKAAISRIPSADCYGISVMCSNHVYAGCCVEQARRANPQALVVAGGANPSALPDQTLRDLDLDAVICGEGEDALVGLVESPDSIRTIPIRQGVGRVDIDSYPLPARDLVDLSTYTKRLNGRPTASVISSRGCPYNCMHCNSSVMGGGSRGARYRSADNLRFEIEELIHLGFSHLRFSDDNFTANPNLDPVLRMLSNYNLTFRVFGRLDDLNSEVAARLKEAGCVHIAVGLESLNPANLRAVGKGSQIGKFGNIAIAKRHGLVVRASFMVGLPFDTDSSIEQYFTEAARLPFDEFEVHPLIPFPGTRVAENPGRWGYRIVKDDFRNYVLVGRNRRTTFALEHENFGPEKVESWRNTAAEILRSRNKIFMKDSPIAQ